MRQMLLIAAKDLRQRLRDRSVFIVGLIAPAMLATIFTFAFGDLIAPGGGGFTATYGVVDLDGGTAATGLTDVLDAIAADGQFTVERYPSVSAAEQAIDDDEVSAVFVVPDGFTEAVAASGGELEVIGNVDAPTGSGIAAAIADGYAGEVDRVALTIAAAISAGAAPGEAESIVGVASDAPPLVTVSEITTGVRQMDGPTYLMAGMAVFFLFFTVQFGVASLLEERRLKTWDRLLSAPLSRGVVIGAKALVSFVLGVVSMAVLMLGATVGLGAEWGDPLAVSALVVVGVLAATGVMALVSAVARTVESAGNLQSIIAVALGMLGGTFVPVAQDGGIFARLSLVTPHQWFIRGLNDLAGGGGITDVVPSLAAVGAFAAITGGAAIWAFARKESI